MAVTLRLRVLSCFLPGNYRVITGITAGKPNLGQSYGKAQ